MLEARLLQAEAPAADVRAEVGALRDGVLARLVFRPAVEIRARVTVGVALLAVRRERVTSPIVRVDFLPDSRLIVAVHVHRHLQRQPRAEQLGTDPLERESVSVN